MEVCELILTPSLNHSLTVAATSFHKCMWGTGLLCSAFYFSLLSDAPSTTAEELQYFAWLLCQINPEWSPHVSRPAVWGLFRLLQTLTKKHFIQLTTYRLLLTIIFGKIRQKNFNFTNFSPHNFDAASSPGKQSVKNSILCF